MAKKRISEVIQTEKFHEEIEVKPLIKLDILDKDITVYDCSRPMKFSKSKYGNDNVMILISFDEDEKNEKYLAWVTGKVILDQMNKLIAQKDLPCDEGIEMKLIKTDKYYKFV